MWGVQPGTSSTYANSPAMPTGETAPQNMGIFTYTVGSALVNPNLAFVDWPPTIASTTCRLRPAPAERAGTRDAGVGWHGDGGLRAYRRRVAA